jgi:putative methyltransferase (TIGR04325 family)
MRVAEIARLLVPPIIPLLLARWRPAERAYIGPNWPAQVPQGWEDGATAQLMRRNWPAIASRICGTEPLSVLPSRSDRSDLIAHNMLMTFLYALARASHCKDRLSVLDWGGALGHYALVARRLLPDVGFDYVVKEVDSLRRLANELNPSVEFSGSDEECFSRTYDFVMASGSVHYVRDWKAMVARLARAADTWLFINCLPVVRHAGGYVVAQRLHSLGFEEGFYSNVVNRDEFIAWVAEQDFALEREFLSWNTVSYRDAPEDSTGAGFLFKRKQERKSGSVT